MARKELKWLQSAADGKKRYIVIITLLRVILSVSGVAFALILREVIDFAVAGDKDSFFFYVGAAICLVALQIILRAVDRQLSESTRADIENACKLKVYSGLLEKDFASVNARHSSKWMSRITSDTVVCANGIVDIIPGVTSLAVKMVSAFAMILTLEPKLAFILLPLGLFAFLFTSVFRKKMKSLHKDVQEKDADLRAYMQENLGSLLVLKAFSAEKDSEKKADEKMADHKRARMKRAVFSNAANLGFSVAMNAVYLIGGVIYCGYGILNGRVTYGTFTAILQLVGQIQSPLANITGYLPRYYAMIASAERLMDAEKYEDDCRGESLTAGEAEKYYRDEFIGIDFRHVTFTYPPGEERADRTLALKDLCLSVKKGDYTAFAGESGCGKSTVLKLILGLYDPDEGECVIEGKSGEKRIDASFRGLFAYVPQGNYLLSGTIREIVTFADKSRARDDKAIEKALRIACAYDFVKGLDEGTDTVLGEKGQGISEGQMQRLAIARAVFSKRPILLLDEATGALDEETESRVLANLKSMTDKTVIIVTHRKKAFEICDKIIYFTEGGVRAKSPRGQNPL